MPRTRGNQPSTRRNEDPDDILEHLAVIARPSRNYGQYSIVAVDPGDHHVGVAMGYGLGPSPHDDELVVSLEASPFAFLYALSQAVAAGWVDILVMEEFTLIPDKALQQSGSRMETARMLGAMGWIVAAHNLDYLRIRSDATSRDPQHRPGAHTLDMLHRLFQNPDDPDGAAPRPDERPIFPFYQPPSLKVTMRSVLRSMGIEPAPSGNSEHARDAQLHWWYFLMSQRRLLKGVSPATFSLDSGGIILPSPR